MKLQGSKKVLYEVIIGKKKNVTKVFKPIVTSVIPLSTV